MTVYIMLDTETTGLDTRSALAWDISMVAFNSKYEVLEDHCAIIGRHPSIWEPSTLAFAKKTYSEDVFTIATTLLDYDLEIERTDGVIKFIKKYTDMVGLKNVYLICNHVEFDWPILLRSIEDIYGAGTDAHDLFHYQNKLDLQSLCRGRVGEHWAMEYKEFRTANKGPAHTGLEDCYSQISMLQWFGVTFPH